MQKFNNLSEYSHTILLNISIMVFGIILSSYILKSAGDDFSSFYALEVAFYVLIEGIIAALLFPAVKR